MSENNPLLDSQGWREEAESVIKDIKDHVKSITVSSSLQSTNSCIYLNLETLEEEKYTLELTVQGFRICGKNFDENSTEDGPYYETPYALLNSISAAFGNSFLNTLFTKLNYCIR